MKQYDELDVIEFAQKCVSEFATSIIDRATGGLPDDATLTARALRRIISEERERWFRRMKEQQMLPGSGVDDTETRRNKRR
jgi:hypothetical protein